MDPQMLQDAHAMQNELKRGPDGGGGGGAPARAHVVLFVLRWPPWEVVVGFSKISPHSYDTTKMRLLVAIFTASIVWAIICIKMTSRYKNTTSWASSGIISTFPTSSIQNPASSIDKMIYQK